MVEEETRVHEARFISLVLSLQNSAWIALGKVANPLTGKVEKDLEAARGSINLLEMLKVKTRGNLSPGEEKFLAEGLSTLQINWVDESSRQKEEETKKKAEEKPQEPRKPAEEKEAQAPQRPQEPEKPQGEKKPQEKTKPDEEKGKNR